MRLNIAPPLLLALAAAAWATPGHAQLVAGLAFGAERNVEDTQAEPDGWANATVEWTLPSGFTLGIGTDHQFEAGPFSPSDHQSWAVYATSSYELVAGPVAPFVRGGLGMGRAPCDFDTCGGGAYTRASAGLRVRLPAGLTATSELGLSRVSRPFGGAGVSVRF